ncbi:pep-cterm sorting domain-containing protein [Anaeramoeba ignava]|uniref:Pep-cterm sorting domain-containing protein n=1 Tax=Anaeramoeba ignava TaxID=1746090 RepID=A0A9Q0LR85_ANAIG|nr:pep-cterm sorting domain-containing protein [Anaeramoeba ignava]
MKKNYSNLEKLSSDLKNLFQNQKQEENHFDFEIICQQNQKAKQFQFKTHKSILSTRSQYFKSLFNSKMKEYQENKLILKDFSNSILSSILNYLYSGKIEINSENAVEILMFSSKYLIDELIEVSSNFIKQNLQIETIIDILKLSELMDLNELSESSYQFISEKFDKFIKTPFFLELEENHLNTILLNDELLVNEFEIFQSLIKWGKRKLNISQEIKNENIDKEEKEKLQDQFSNLIQKIRFIDFSQQEMRDTLKEDLIPNPISQKINQFLIIQNENNETKLKEFIQKENMLIFKPRFRFGSSIIQERKHFDKLKEWVSDDNFFSRMKLGFSARKNGFDCKKWHLAVDNKGKTLVIIKTRDNFIFGGFTQVGWSSGERRWIRDPKAFIFSLRNDKNNRKPAKLPIKRAQENNAICYRYFDGGPFFGTGYDLWLYSDLQPGFSNLGQTYKLPKGIKFGSNEAKSYLAGSYNKWKVAELETFFI